MPNRRIALPANTHAALLFVDDHYVFRSFKEGGTKIVPAGAVRQAFSNEPIDSGWLPQGVLRWGTGKHGAWAIMYFPPAVYRLSLDRSDEAGTRQMRAFSCPMPGLVWCGRGNHYYVWAARVTNLKGKTNLYHAPLPNVNDIGLICFGPNNHPDISNGGIVAAWRTFWKAPFSPHHDQGKSRSQPNSICEKLVSLKGSQSYPIRDMVPMEITVDDAVRSISGAREDFDVEF